MKSHSLHLYSSSPPSSLHSRRSLGGVSQPSILRIWEQQNRIQLNPNSNQGCKRRGRGVCRAELAQDAPFAAAIGACVLNSLVFPAPPSDDDDEEGGGGGAFGSVGTRFAVMGIISFIPYFNWMSWVFAWLDSGRRRYLVYSIVYLVPYLRTNLSISPDESWLPIASILVCIAHIQLEASITNGDLNDVQIFDGARKIFAPMIRKKESLLQNHKEFSKKGMSKGNEELPSAEEIRDNFRDREWRIPRKPVDDKQQINDKTDVDAEE